MSRESELGVLGCVLIDGGIVPELMGLLDPADFQDGTCRAVYQAVKDLFLEERAVDAIGILGRLPRDPAYKVFLAECAAAASAASQFRDYARITRDDAKRRRASALTGELLETLSTGDVEDCREKALAVAEALGEDRRDRALTAKEGLCRFFITKQQPKEYLKTGFGFLDRNAHLDRGDYVVVGGRPSSGKTAFTLQMALQMAREHNVVYFSLETSADKLFDRLISNAAGLHLSAIKTGNPEFEKAARIADEFSKLRLTVVEAAGWSVPRLKAKAIQLGAEVILIDYLSLLSGEGRSMLERITNISIALHTMAQQTGILVVALSQLNREGRGEPTMEHLRESGQVEQDADLIILLYNPDRDGDGSRRKVIIAKNKEGLTGARMFRFYGETQYFVEEVREG